METPITIRQSGIPETWTGPMEAMESYLAENEDFEIDASRERFLMTLNPKGFLKRVR